MRQAIARMLRDFADALCPLRIPDNQLERAVRDIFTGPSNIILTYGKVDIDPAILDRADIITLE